MRSPWQTLAAIASIAFITALLFMQIGFRSAFLHSLLELPSIYTTPITMPDPSGQPELLRRVLVLGFPLVQSPLAIPAVYKHNDGRTW